MPNCILATTQHFEIVWWPGKDERGLYISRFEEGESESNSREDAQCFVDLELVPALISELRGDTESITILSRVTSEFVPGFHPQPKKNGGDPKLAYYKPLPVEGELRPVLADALEAACGREAVSRVEAKHDSDYYTVLGGQYLEGEVWHSLRDGQVLDGSVMAPYGTSGVRDAIEIPSHQLAQTPKQRFRAPSGKVSGKGVTTLRVAKDKHRCCNRPCIDYAWIKPDSCYVEQRKGKSILRYHIKCAFRGRVIPDNWLSPHFEQYHALLELGFQAWINEERKKVPGFDEEKLIAASNRDGVENFVQKMREGYELDAFERADWREFLHHVPIDIEPCATARRLMGLSAPKKRTEVGEAKTQLVR